MHCYLVVKIHAPWPASCRHYRHLIRNGEITRIRFKNMEGKKNGEEGKKKKKMNSLLNHLAIFFFFSFFIPLLPFNFFKPNIKPKVCVNRQLQFSISPLISKSHYFSEFYLHLNGDNNNTNIIVH